MTEGRKPHTGRLRLEIICKFKGQVVFHRAGPANIVYGLYDKFLESWEVLRHA